MMEIALRARLKDNAAVSAITTRVFWSVRDQGSALPCIVLTVVSDAMTQHMAGFDTYRATRVQVDCYAATKAASTELRATVITALVGEETKSGVRFLRAFINSVADRGEQTDAGFIHRESLDFTIWHDA